MALPGAVALAGCGAAKVPREPTAEEREGIAHATASLTALGQGLALGDSLFHFDAAIDASKTSEQIAASLHGIAEVSVAGCATTSVIGSALSIDFPAAGCALKTGLRVSGSTVLEVAKAGPVIDMTTGFTKLVADGKELNGVVWYCTPAGTNFTVPANLVLDDSKDTITATVAGAKGSFTIQGHTTSLRDAATSTYEYDHVVWRTGDCYPNAGSLTLHTPSVGLTLTFFAATATSGRVAVSQGAFLYETTLPAYGTCAPK